jgi:hypothetical protein
MARPILKISLCRPRSTTTWRFSRVPTSRSAVSLRTIGAIRTPRPGDSIFILAGQMEIGIGNGTTRRFGPGDVVLADDLTGQGHTTRSLGVPRVSATVPVGA